ncbi:LysR family transcriptional regulator [Falsiroseomonas oryzae]|uniref:LysR family transcriptional regulator n=1 Tax=Falsiroseomonas oryzae TaxID=2766473 RepID=UPI0022EADD86|nr:LysR family transcriptional regulator [Roseomonas sp. MO-31]
MDTLLNIRAFLATARAGSFSAAARELNVAPSVVIKRINRLEDQMRARLFLRSTRRLTLTEAGERARPRYQAILAEIEAALAGGIAPPDGGPGGGIQGHLRIKAPTTFGILRLGAILPEFQQAHPRVTVEVVLVDRSVNPAEEGFDIALGALPVSYAHVEDVPLCPYPRVLCAAPEYVARRGAPQRPADLPDHDCLTYAATGSTWSFASPRGPVTVDVRARFSANEGQLLMAAARRGLGIAVLPQDAAAAALEEGTLVALMPEYPVAPLWLKALVPEGRRGRAPVKALLDWLREKLSAPS